ncbi:MAG: hypothetical protein NZ480_08070 [Bdellovibrionaceae bacterium]|nr:hypothetical protein [Pseudobdellovibrionaceae bacterium]MDW8189580.1 hypothetical protein [Pseudobdellovibrionaceae bacterium]
MDWFRIYFLILFMLIPFQLRAEPSSSSPEVRKEVLNFEDELVEGRDAKPELFYLLQQKKMNYKKLIRLREHFIPEARSDSENLRIKRGKD